MSNLPTPPDGNFLDPHARLFGRPIYPTWGQAVGAALEVADQTDVPKLVRGVKLYGDWWWQVLSISERGVYPRQWPPASDPWPRGWERERVHRIWVEANSEPTAA